MMHNANLGNINLPGIDSDGRVFATPGMFNLSATMATYSKDVTNKSVTISLANWIISNFCCHSNHHITAEQ